MENNVEFRAIRKGRAKKNVSFFLHLNLCYLDFEIDNLSVFLYKNQFTFNLKEFFFTIFSRTCIKIFLPK